MEYNNLLLFEYRPCGHSEVIEESLPESSIHHAQQRCATCGSFIKWIPKRKTNEVSIGKLLQNTRLETWERKFLKAIVYRKPNKAEQIVVDAIAAKVNPVSSEQT